MQSLNPEKARLAVVITALIWSSSGLAIKLADASPTLLTGLRSIFCLALFTLVYRKEKLLTFSKAQCLGAIAYFLQAYSYAAATKWTTAANAILLQYTAPIFVALLSGILLNERVTKGDWITVFVVMLGVSLFFMDQASVGGLIGNITALGSGLFFALFIIFTRMQKLEHPAGSVYLGNVIALLVCLPSLINEPVTLSGVAGGAYMGLINGGLAYILYSSAIKSISALTAILLATIEPILNPIWVYFAIGEKPSLFTIIGGTIVVLTLLIKNVTDLMKQKTRQ